MPLRYRIEYLADRDQTHVVCHSRLARSEVLAEAIRDAWEGSFLARRLYGANAFQIRDMHDEWKVVVSDQFEAPKD
jgi:hypothetical protein